LIVVASVVGLTSLLYHDARTVIQGVEEDGVGLGKQSVGASLPDIGTVGVIIE